MSDELLQQEILSRMTGVYEYSRSTSRDDSTLNARMFRMHDNTRIYFRYIIPNWPLRQLVSKVVRRLLRPIMMPQVEFNESVRDVLDEIRQAQQRQLAAQDESVSMVAELGQQIEYLEGQIATLRQAITNLNESGSNSPAAKESAGR